jgi:hypothetical protein
MMSGLRLCSPRRGRAELQRRLRGPPTDAEFVLALRAAFRRAGFGVREAADAACGVGGVRGLLISESTGPWGPNGAASAAGYGASEGCKLARRVPRRPLRVPAANQQELHAVIVTHCGGHALHRARAGAPGTPQPRGPPFCHALLPERRSASSHRPNRAAHSVSSPRLRIAWLPVEENSQAVWPRGEGSRAQPWLAGGALCRCWRRCCSRPRLQQLRMSLRKR